MSAYSHSFSPAATGRYLLQLMQAGYGFDMALIQTTTEHGHEQGAEILRLLRGEMGERNWQDYRCLYPAIRRAIRRAETRERARC
jgi:hypothetical protein